MELIETIDTDIMRNKNGKIITEVQKQAWENQVKYMETSYENNKMYWDEFVNYKFPTEKQRMSMSQYKSSIFKFIKFIDKDLSLITKDDINRFVANENNLYTVKNKIAHIKSILTFIVQFNSANCLDRISKDTLILIIQL